MNLLNKTKNKARNAPSREVFLALSFLFCVICHSGLTDYIDLNLTRIL